MVHRATWLVGTPNTTDPYLWWRQISPVASLIIFVVEGKGKESAELWLLLGLVGELPGMVDKTVETQMQLDKVPQSLQIRQSRTCKFKPFEFGELQKLPLWTLKSQTSMEKVNLDQTICTFDLLPSGSSDSKCCYPVHSEHFSPT